MNSQRRTNNLTCVSAIPAGLLILSFFPARTIAETHDIVNIVDTTGRYSRVNFPSINDHGVVSGTAELSGSDVDVLLRVDNGTITEVYEEDSNLAHNFANQGPWMNNNGTLAFRAVMNDHSGFFIGDGGPILTIASYGGEYHPAANRLAINDSDVVAFVGNHFGELGIFVSDGGPPAQIPTDNAFEGLGIAAIDSHGYVAYWGGDSFTGAGFKGSHAIYLYDGAQTITVAQTGDQYKRLLERVSMNDNGQVLFMAVPTDMPRALLVVGDGEDLTTILDASGPFLDFSQGYGINNSGEIAVWAVLDDFRQGIFTGPDPNLDRIAVQGDSLFGSFIAELEYGDLNNRGQIAFRYLLDNGTHGIAVATPVRIPRCDFDGTDACDVDDINALITVMTAGTNDANFDLTGDSVVNVADRDVWLLEAAMENGFGSAYLVGDANLDRTIDAHDLNALGKNWLGHPNAWQSGDFNADGIVDAIDLNEIEQKWLVSIPLAESTCDIDGDTLCNTIDLDLLTGAGDLTSGLPVPPDDAQLDVNADGQVDTGDLDEWLAAAAAENGFGLRYFKGDANLDGIVDASDLNALALNWQQNVALWSGGDFTADGVVDSADLNKLALNWRESIPMAASATAPVPEPSAWLLTIVGLALAWRRPRSR